MYQFLINRKKVGELIGNLEYWNKKYYILKKDYVKKINNKLAEFCFEERYKIIEKAIFNKRSSLILEYQRMKEKNKVSLAYYIERWYSSDIVIWDRLWLVKEDVIKWLKERLWEERLKEQVEFYKIYLLPERYALEEDEKLFKMIIEWKKLEGLIDEYYIINVLNYYIFREFKERNFRKKWNDIIVVLKDYMESKGELIVSEDVKEIIDRFDLWIYKFVEYKEDE